MLISGAATCGIGPHDVLFFTHDGIFGGGLVWMGFRVLRDHLPEGWREKEQLQLIQLLEVRLRSAVAALRKPS